MKNKKYYVDPPFGHRYGFPKQAPDTMVQWDREYIAHWLVANGYPKEEAYWAASACRYITKENDE